MLADKLVSVIRSFSANWKRSVEAINGEIVKSFTNFKSGSNILQVGSLERLEYRCCDRDDGSNSLRRILDSLF